MKFEAFEAILLDCSIIFIIHCPFLCFTWLLRATDFIQPWVQRLIPSIFSFDRPSIRSLVLSLISAARSPAIVLPCVADAHSHLNLQNQFIRSTCALPSRCFSWFHPVQSYSSIIPSPKSLLPIFATFVSFIVSHFIKVQIIRFLSSTFLLENASAAIKFYL